MGRERLYGELKRGVRVIDFSLERELGKANMFTNKNKVFTPVKLYLFRVTV